MVQSSLVGWWPLHEWAGRASDISGNDNHGTVSGPSQGVSGKSGLTAYSFDSSNNDYVDVGSGSFVEGASQITCSFWARPTNPATGSTQYVIGKLTGNPTSAYFIQDDGDGNWFFNARNESGTDGEIRAGRVGADTWQHMVAVYNGSGGIMKLYKDGELIGTDSVSGAINSGGSNLFFGRQDNGSYYDGNIADVRFYNRPLSESEIQHLYEIGNSDVATPPAAGDSAAVSRYAFDDRSDTSTALDTFGSRNGDIRNGTAYSVDSIRGLSLDFDGSNDYVQIGQASNSAIAGATEVTFSTWIKPEDGGFDGRVYTLRDDTSSDVYIRHDTSEQMRVEIVDDAGNTLLYDTGKTIPINSWTHFSFVWSGGNDLTIYHNGADVTATYRKFIEGSPSEVLTANQDETIGAYSENDSAVGQFYNGKIDDLRLYTRALSDEEIHQLYNWGTRGIDRRYELIRK